jgi:hypothetical protein
LRICGKDCAVETQQFLEVKSGILYLACMRFGYLLLGMLFFTGCASRDISVNLAKDRIMEIPHSSLKKNDVDVKKITQIGGSEAIAETNLRMAFRLEKIGGEWIVQEVRIGHGQWERMDNLAAALEAVKTEETKQMLERIAEAIEKYRKATGTLPTFKDYVDLSDQLSPRYLTPLIRLDSWRRPLEAERTAADAILLQSAGPDGEFGTSDDIRKTISP